MQQMTPSAPDPPVTIKSFPSGPERSPAEARRWFNLLLPIVQPLAGYVAPLTGFGHTVQSISDAHVTPVTPAGYAFAIWLPIFALAIAWGIWQSLPGGRDTALARRLGWPLAMAFAANILWMLLAQFTGMGWHLVIVILGGLVFAVIAFLMFVRDPGEGGIGRMIAAPLTGLLAGWVSMASFVNVATAARASGLIVDGAAGSFTAVLLLLAAGGLATAIVALVRPAIWYVAAVVWALVAIVLANAGWRAVDLAPAITAGVMVAVVIAVHVMRRGRDTAPAA